MAVYVISLMIAEMMDAAEVIIGVADSPDLAKEFVRKRTGEIHTWTEHNSHGLMWVNEEWRPHRYFIQEFEVMHGLG